MFLLVIGDFHIPDREKEIPSEILHAINLSKFDLILCTGDLTDFNIFKKLQSLTNVEIVIGNMDYYFGSRAFPRSASIKLENCKIGLIHGTGVRPRGNPRALAKIAHELVVDVLISGHTHTQSVGVCDNILLMNPGSATGSWGGGSSTGIPSFQTIEEIDKKLKIVSSFLKSGRIQQRINFYNVETKTLE